MYRFVADGLPRHTAVTRVCQSPTEGCIRARAFIPGDQAT